ncbi:molecular chaperone DnaJ [Rickettsia canadensis]|uniref:Chaperone protein DnaJ n=1 Tax=Rickettsia canadensis str. CA410 TaxID=1105107 RepID=A0ABM5MS44_RICCA|nr:molecular chaperone DnaJ [Rickettsia canadensis]AFB20754.1 chaperone protein DnaJ [Rickettsia canadensis str. CA410]
MSQDYYQILGVSKTASSAELKKAYHKLAKQYHPDNAAAGDTNAEKKFKEINAAYDVLKDEQKRAAYDRFGHDAFQNQQSRRGAGGGTSSFHPDINDIFGDFFSDFMGGSRRSRPTSSKVRGSDLKYDLTINLEEAFHGIEKNISFSSEVQCDTCHGNGSEKGETITTCDACSGVGVTRIQQGFFTIEQTCHKCQGNGQMIKNPCKKCHGMGRYHKQRNLLVNIPAGVENGTRIRHTGEGEAGIRGGNSGDLYVDISIKPHDIYKVDGANLHCKLPISFVNAALGGEVEVPIIEGGKVNLTIPAGTQNGDQLRLRSKGMSKMRSTIRGDMLTHIHVEVPKNLSKRQRELLEEFKKESISEKENDSSFFNKMKSLWS